MSSTNNVDRMTKASLVPLSKRSNSELSVDGLALLASTVIAEWDRNGQQNRILLTIARRKMLELSKMSIVSREDRWLEKYNQLKEFYQRHGFVPVTSSNCEDKSLAHWGGVHYAHVYLHQSLGICAHHVINVSIMKQHKYCVSEEVIDMLEGNRDIAGCAQKKIQMWLQNFKQAKACFNYY